MKNIKIVIISIVVTLVVAGAVAFTWQARNATEPSSAGDKQSSSQTDTETKEGTTLNQDDFATPEEYMGAVIDAQAPEVDVPYELLPPNEDGVYYVRGSVYVGFKKTCPESRAREIVTKVGAQWVSSDYATLAYHSDAHVTTYIPDREEEAVAAFRQYSEVEYADWDCGEKSIDAGN